MPGGGAGDRHGGASVQHGHGDAAHRGHERQRACLHQRVVPSVCEGGCSGQLKHHHSRGSVKSLEVVL